jgi:hypothetical protein
MTELSVIFGLCVLASSVIILYLIKVGREERQELEDRLMEISKPESAILHKAQRDPTPASVDYIDEDREFELEHKNGRPVLLGDDD